MPPSTPFVDTVALDTEQNLAEAITLATLIGPVIGLTLVPRMIGFLLGGHSVFAVRSTILAQFILAAGVGLLLMYVIARAMQLAGE